MNTVTDLRAEFHVLEINAPSDTDVRQSLAGRIERHAKRRRTTALIAAAAAVAVVAGGAGIAGAVLSHRSAGPAAPTPVVTVPDVPLPPGSKLIRHRLQPVTAPVTVTPPKGLTGRTWISAPGRLAVSWFNPRASGDSLFGGTASAPLNSSAPSGPQAAGYVVTDSRDDALVLLGGRQPAEAPVKSSPITVGGHPAILQTAPSSATDEFGFPAEKRITWQLADGRWIHVWTTGLGDPQALESFAGSMTDKPQTLNRTIGIGVTLPGLTVDSSMNSWPASSIEGASVLLCPPGVDPMAPTYSSSTGSGSSTPGGSATSSQTTSSADPANGCVMATAMNLPVQQRNSFAAKTTVTVGGTTAHVDTTGSVAWADLGDGLTAVAKAPESAHLSAADLAALVASIRVSPAVTVLPATPPHVIQGPVGVTAATSGPATPVPHPSAPPSTLPVVPVTAATDRPGDVSSSMRARQPAAASAMSSMQSAVSSLQSAVRSAASAAGSAREAALQRQVVTEYLDAVKAGDCVTADTYFIGRKDDGDLCHMGGLRLLAYQIDGAPATPSPDEAEVAVRITITGGDVTMPDGTMLWFFDLHRQPDGSWRIVSGGSGP